MAKKSLVIEILGNNKFGRTVRDVLGSLSKIGGVAKSIGRGLFTTFKYAAAGVGVLVSGLAYASKVYAVQEQADADLTAAINKTGGAVNDLLPLLKKQASAIQAETKYGDEFIQTLQAQAINMGINATEATKATRAALGLAKAYGIDAKAALVLVAKARAGNTTALSRYGIELDKNMSKEEKYQAILKIGQGSYRLVRDEVNTLGGRYAQLKNVIGDVIEEFGGAFVEGTDLQKVFEKMAVKAADFGTELKSKLLPYFQQFKNIVDGLLSGGEDRSKAIENIKQVFSGAMDIMRPKFEEWGAAVGGAIWRGFKAGGKSIVMGASERAEGALESSTVGRAFRAASPLPGIAATAGALSGGSSLVDALNAGAAEQMSAVRSVFQPGSAPTNPIYVQEIKPISGVEK